MSSFTHSDMQEMHVSAQCKEFLILSHFLTLSFLAAY